jgi:transcriptional regulator with XRE-family HTH domain
MTKVWKKFARKAYRDSFVGAHISNTVSSQISKLRDKEGWTQTQLAERAGMRQSRISALEDPNYENYEVRTLRRIASALDVALTVRFISFSELARWSAELSEQNLAVSKFEEDELNKQTSSLAERPSSALIAFFKIPEQEAPAHRAQPDDSSSASPAVASFSRWGTQLNA